MSARSYTDSLKTAPMSTSPARDLGAFTFTSGGEWFGLPISSVFSVFTVDTFTPVPLAPPEIVGLINLRGMIVTAVSMRQRLGLAREAKVCGALAVGMHHEGENYALIVDDVEDVIDLMPSQRLPTPANVDPFRSALTRQIYYLEDRILSVLDLPALMAFSSSTRRMAGLASP